MCAVVLAVASCRAGPDEPSAVAECQEYEAAFARCTGVKAAIASQRAALASTEGDRERLKKVCQDNLDRLKQSCR